MQQACTDCYMLLFLYLNQYEERGAAVEAVINHLKEEKLIKKWGKQLPNNFNVMNKQVKKRIMNHVCVLNLLCQVFFFFLY